MGLAIARPISRAAWATLCAVLLVAAATAASFLTTTSKSISLLFEPLSLFLMPGLLFSLLTAGPHDYSPCSVIIVSLIVYAAFFYFALGWLARHSRKP